MTTTTDNAETGTSSAEATPTFIPTAVFQTVTVVAADSIPETTTTHAEITQYPGPQATILQGHCSEPAYTILDMPEMALWVPVIGCISSKSECCPTSTASSSEATSTGGSKRIKARDDEKKVQFPISRMPLQGTLTGCPQDYHTVDSTACCPSSYWLWTTEIGGQVPCYSSLAAKMTPPPIPETFAHHITRPDAHSSATLSSESQKPTSAVVNIAYAMQYRVVAVPKKGFSTKIKIGLGVGVGVAAILVGLLLALVIRKFFIHRRVRSKVQGAGSEPLRGGVVESMSQVELLPAPNSRNYEGSKYAGVSSTGFGH
jgi:hypothetical protein